MIRSLNAISSKLATVSNLPASKLMTILTQLILAVCPVAISGCFKTFESVTYTEIQTLEPFRLLDYNDLNDEYESMKEGEKLVGLKNGKLILASWTDEALEPLAELIAEKKVAHTEAEEKKEAELAAAVKDKTVTAGPFEFYCRRSGGYPGLYRSQFSGTIKNTGDTPYTFVRLRVDYYDDGEVVDSNYTYIVDSLALRPGESRKWELRDKASLLGYQMAIESYR